MERRISPHPRLASFALLASLTIALTGCPPAENGGNAPTDAGPPDVRTDTDTGVDGGDTDSFHLNSVYSDKANGFTTSKSCAGCHSNQRGVDAMRDEEGRGVAPYDLWQASMMANATRDPFWRAAVSAEVAASPGAEQQIEDKCMRCHAPMAYTANNRRGNKYISTDALHREDSIGQLALDGVSCSGCHAIAPDNLGEPASFTGNFVMNTDDEIYGPHADPHMGPMKQNTGLSPVQSDHMRDSALCASCHTLTTTPVDESGDPTIDGHFSEQTPFLEWKNSSYSSSSDGPIETCQDCHEPSTDRDGNPIETQIAVSKLGSPYPTEDVPERSPYGRHIFVGGNTLVPGIIRDNADVLNPIASEEAFNELIDRVERQLQNRTATVDIADAQVTDGQLTFDVDTQIQTGHKFPTGYPSRRAWLHVTIKDADGDTVFDSGDFDQIGQLLGPQDQPLPTEQPGNPVVPHHETITSDDQVQLYQSVMQNAAGEVTWRLMKAASYRKDNRLLPDGWSSDHPQIDEMNPVGTDGDPDFTAGGDRTAYDISLPTDAKAPFEIDVSLHYQTLSPRFARALFQTDTAPVNRFERYWQNADRSPELIDTATTQLTP